MVVKVDCPEWLKSRCPIASRWLLDRWIMTMREVTRFNATPCVLETQSRLIFTQNTRRPPLLVFTRNTWHPQLFGLHQMRWLEYGEKSSTVRIRFDSRCPTAQRWWKDWQIAIVRDVRRYSRNTRNKELFGLHLEYLTYGVGQSSLRILDATDSGFSLAILDSRIWQVFI